MKALVLGHFSTIGDIESLAYVEAVLRDQQVPYDVHAYLNRVNRRLNGAIERSALDPATYTHLIVVCGPFWPDLLARRGIDLERFAHCTRIGVNLTMVEPLEEWNPFHALVERDSNRAVRPDITLLQETGKVPVAGLCTISAQREYGRRQRHEEAVRLLRDLAQRRGLAVVEIDTRWPSERNSAGLGSPEEVSSLIGRTDVLLTNRLHGMVYALKARVPVIAIDPVEGGGKVTAQARVLGWRAVMTVEAASPGGLDELLDWCLSNEGRAAARAVQSNAGERLKHADEELRRALRTDFPPQPVPRPPITARASAGRRLIRAIRRWVS